MEQKILCPPLPPRPRANMVKILGLNVWNNFSDAPKQPFTELLIGNYLRVNKEQNKKVQLY